MGLVGITELTINLIRNKEQIMLLGNLAKGKHVLLCIKSSGRISRIADENSLGTWSDEFLKLGHVRNLEPVTDIGRNSFESNPVHECECIVIRVERLKHNHFITLVASNLEREIHALAAGNSDNKFRNINVNAYFPVVFLYQPFPEFDQPCRVGIGNVIEVVLLHGIQCTLWRFDIRLTDIEMINFYAFRFGGIGKRNQLSDS